MLVDGLIARLQDKVPALASRVEGALELSEMLRRNALPQATPFAFVVPAGLRARGEGDAGAGFFVQSVDRIVSVILVLRTAGDVRGSKSQPKLDALIETVVGAVCGYDIEEAIGVFRLVRGHTERLAAGAVFYQLDFALQDQIRVIP